MKKKILYVLMVLAAGASFTSCDDFLDTLPDNRTTIDTEEKVKSILTSAYPDKTYALVTELIILIIMESRILIPTASLIRYTPGRM